jgi:hypothetical protein
MGMSKKAWRRLATAVAVPGTALGALAGFAAAPAMAGTAQPQLMSPNETFYGYSTVYSQYIPVNASGVISDRGYLDLTGNRQAIVVLRHGSIYVSISQRHDSISLDPRKCGVTKTEAFRYQITGGSQRYHGAQGDGRGSIEVTAVVRRYHGMCELTAPIPNRTSVRVEAVGYVR